MKIFKRTLYVLVVLLIIAVVYNYPKLNILAGYSAKNVASSVFLANRSLVYTDTVDNNFSPVNLASDVLDITKKTATSSAFGLLTRKAIYRKGLGSVLMLDDKDETASYLVPKRKKQISNAPYPYGNASQKDTIIKNIDYKNLDKAVTSVFKKSKTRSVLVIYKDVVIVEKYSDGFDENSKLLGWSMTKSILSTIFGVLEHQHKININKRAPIASWQSDERKNITIHNLLQMNSGLEWDENYATISDATKMLFLDRDMTKTQEEKQLVGKPNASWNYSSGTSNLLSGILRKQFKTHQEYLDYWYSNLIDKIGMNSMVLEADLSGNYVGSSYSWATTRDWAKFGLLYLHNGNWNGTPLFTKQWVDYITEPTPASKGGYGAHFWLNKGGKLKDIPKNMYYAKGFQGQRVYVLPDQEMVVVRMGLGEFNENDFLREVINSVRN